MNPIFINSRTTNSQVLNCQTGFADLDSQIRLFKPGEVTAICGRPGMGKSTIAIAMHEHIVNNEDAHAVLLGSAKCNVLELLDPEFETFINNQDIGILFIDDLELLNLLHFDMEFNPLYGTRYEYQRKLNMIMEFLRKLAYAYGISIVVCSQLLPSVRNNDHCIPTMRNVNPAIVKNAQNIVLLYRTSYYDSEQSFPTAIDAVADMEFIVARDSDNEVGREEMEGDYATRLFHFIENTMKLPVNITDIVADDDTSRSVFKAHLKDFEIHFFKDLESFKLSELAEEESYSSPYMDKEYCTLFTMKIPIANETWIMKVGGIGNPWNDGSLMNCIGMSGYDMERLFAFAYDYYLT